MDGIEKYDSQEIYCRMLGHRLKFNYCRTVKEGLPCRKIMDCWFEKLDIKDFVIGNYTEEEQTVIFNPPAEKVSTLIDLIEKAKKRSGGGKLMDTGGKL